MKVIANINRIIDKPDSIVKAFASASFDGYFAVHGIKVCEGEKGLFISMPSTSYSNQNGEKKYQDMWMWRIRKETRFNSVPTTIQ